MVTYEFTIGGGDQHGLVVTNGDAREASDVVVDQECLSALRSGVCELDGKCASSTAHEHHIVGEVGSAIRKWVASIVGNSWVKRGRVKGVRAINREGEDRVVDD